MEAAPDMPPEHRPAWQALRRLTAGVQRGIGHVPLALHGTTGTGKTHLVNGIVERLIGTSEKSAITEAAAELGRELLLPPVERRAQVRELLHADLLIVEDLQHLPPAASDELAYIIDHRQARRKSNIITANIGPAGWNVSPRLASRLVGGLVVGIPMLRPESRRAVAAAVCRERNIDVTPEVLDWLARHGGGLRPMLGDINRLEALAKITPGTLTLPVVLDALTEPVSDGPQLLDRLSAKVEQRFRVPHKMLVGPSRLKNVVWPRQLVMHLAREAGMSLADIGAYFGNRDHTTVGHAIEKVRGELTKDAELREWLKSVSHE
jgi:chromosomal replication initiator protein